MGELYWEKISKETFDQKCLNLLPIKQIEDINQICVLFSFWDNFEVSFGHLQNYHRSNRYSIDFENNSNNTRTCLIFDISHNNIFRYMDCSFYAMMGTSLYKEISKVIGIHNVANSLWEIPSLIIKIKMIINSYERLIKI